MFEVSLPSDDGVIQRALSDLDEKMLAWSAAMTGAQTSLAEKGQQITPTHTSESKAPAKVPAPSILQPDNRPSANTCVSTKSKPTLEKTSQAPPPVETTTKPPVETKTKKTSIHKDDDEALLASLDKETADTIKVMRRLDPGRKSVRELLAEHELAKSKPSPTVQKSKWW